MTLQINREGEWPRVAIIILNWNGWKDTIECMESLLRITYSNYQIIVVDNGSTDDSIEKIRAWARGEISVESSFFDSNLGTKPVHWFEYDRTTVEAVGFPDEEERLTKFPSNRSLVLFKTTENLGFSGGNNVGIQFALRDKAVQYIWLLNNDTITLEDTLTHLVMQSKKNPELGIFSPKICYYFSPDRIWFAGGKLRLLSAAGYNLGIGKLDGSCYSGLAPCTFITGCAMLIKREVVESIGLLDPLYFLYGEDVDFSWRAIKAGWDLATHLDSLVYHKVSSAVGTDPLLLQTYYISRNRPYFSAKYHSHFQRMAFNLFWILSRAAKFCSWFMKGRKDLIRATMQGYIDYKKGRMGISCN
jgi:GT2 family glycosyltransferase